MGQGDDLIAALAIIALGKIVYDALKKYNCPRCNYPVDKTNRVCPNCGQPLNWREVQ